MMRFQYFRERLQPAMLLPRIDIETKDMPHAREH
jgi:hypothetical protein